MKKPENFYDILGIPKTATLEEIKATYRSQAMFWHPDRNSGDPHAAEMMAKINEAYAVLGDPGKREKYDRGTLDKPIVIGNKRFSIELMRQVAKGDLADVYLGKASSGKLVAVKVARSPAVNDLLEREASAYKLFRPPGSPDEKMFLYYTPFYQQMKIDDGAGRRAANILGWNDNFFTLEQVRERFPRGLPVEQAVWMFNRVMESLDYVHNKHGLVHGSILPPHIMVYSGTDREHDKMVHGARIVDWCYSVKDGERPVAIVPKYKDWYAPEVLDKGRLTGQTDVYMMGATLVYMLGGDPVKRIVPSGVPKYVTEFIKRLMETKRFKRPDGAWEARRELKEILEANFGPRKYVPFDISSAA